MVVEISFRKFLVYITRFLWGKWPVILIALFYTLFILSVIRWGLPNEAHPFNYFMDEWHQLQAVRSVFKYGSNNVAGAAHGPMLHFILSGLYLGILTVLGAVNPFSVNSALSELLMQEKIFIALRINTLIFALLTIFLLFKIARQIKVPPFLPVALFTVNPVFLYQSTYFKYDIALAFWVTLFIYISFRFIDKSIFKNYIVAGIGLGAAVATKISALPLLIPYVVMYFYLGSKKTIRFSQAALGIILFFLTTVILGFPDLIFGKGDYGEFLYSNLIGAPQIYSDFILPTNQWIYLLFSVWPIDFGYLLYCLSVIGVAFFGANFLKRKYEHKKEYFLLVSVIVLLSSVIPLRLGATGNRVVILLPFLSLISSCFLIHILKQRSFFLKKTIIVISFILFCFQVWQSFAVVYGKWVKDTREVSSNWILNNIKKGSEVGIENIPIYQSLPDFLLKENYIKEAKPSYSPFFRYKVIDYRSHTLPKIVIVTDHLFEENYIKKSPKKELIQRLVKEGYTITKEFKGDDLLYRAMGNELNFYTSGVVGVHSIAVYQRK